jgi:L-ascorbate metabolism protein UlaG (beta-lactamase superfamily)
MTLLGGRILPMTDGLRFRWLGTAGIELESRGERILVDPYLSRVPMRYALFGRPAPRRDLVKRHLLPARAVLVSHAHFDHLMDVPNVCREFGAVAYGTANGCRILRAHGIPDRQIRTAASGESVVEGPFAVRFFPGLHGRMAGLLPYTGPLPTRLIPPLRLSDYRMDGMLSFHVQTDEGSILVWNNPAADGIPRSDVLFCCPLWGARTCAQLAEAAGVSLVVPVHWDDFFSPLERPIRPLIAPPGWKSPWIRHIDPVSFADSVRKLAAKIDLVVPDIFQYVEFGKR